MNKFKVIAAVYGYYFLEIRELISNLVKEYPHKEKWGRVEKKQSFFERSSE